MTSRNVAEPEFEAAKNASRSMKNKLRKLTFDEVQSWDKGLAEIKQTRAALRETFSKFKSTDTTQTIVVKVVIYKCTVGKVQKLLTKGVNKYE